ncbi:sensor histidine kinase [Aeromicrobium sp. CF3.5]|uniref:sensor histidine kinase n=1 Tax=Aeromicrobium sp. CF3.5 TaxID=3373078 RepID=UPI003EE81111
MQGVRGFATGRYRGLVVLLVQCCIVIGCVAVTTWAASTIQERQIRDATAERVLAVARSLSALEQVQQAIGAPDASTELQPLADLVGESSGVDYVVITDGEGVRLTHPTPAERGRPVSTDPLIALSGSEFVGTEVGTLGPTLRAKVPIRRDGVVVGAASVGILERDIAADLRDGLWALVPWTLGALIVGCVAAALLARSVSQKVRRLEEDVTELDLQRRVARALRDQTHEFRTRMHVVYGLVESDDSGAALDYIAGLVPVAGPGRRGDDAEIADVRLSALVGAVAVELADGGGELRLAPLTTVAHDVLHDDDLTVIANLLSNAVEATGGDGRVRVFLQADESWIEAVIEDDGPGVAAAVETTLFERGSTTKAAQADHLTRGTGLALVMDVVRARGGHVDVGRSELGGARFAVSLPTATVPESRPVR